MPSQLQLSSDEESAVVVRIQEAEAVVGSHRSRLDPAQAWGVPAHVTVLYPFVPPDELSQDIFEMLGRALTPVDAFDGTLSQTAWFGEEVLWLAPTPDLPFRRLTQAVWDAFPDFPPYEGAHDDVIPHLTVGKTPHASVEDLRAAERDLAPCLPIPYRVDRVTVMSGTQRTASWRVVKSFAL